MTVEIKGIDGVNEILNSIGPREGYNLMRSTVHAIAAGISKDAKKSVPVDEGTLKKAIKHKRERAVGGYVLSTVRVDPSAFYWRFLEYGQGPDRVEYAMFLKAVEEFRTNSDAVFSREFGKKWEAAVARAARKASA